MEYDPLWTSQSPFNSKEIKPVKFKGNHPEYLLEELMLKLQLQYFGHLIRTAAAAAAAAKSLQSCPTPSDPMNCSAPGPSVQGIFQARVLEWVAILFSMLLLSHPLFIINTVDLCAQKLVGGKRTEL